MGMWPKLGKLEPPLGFLLKLLEKRFSPFTGMFSFEEDISLELELRMQWTQSETASCDAVGPIGLSHAYDQLNSWNFQLHRTLDYFLNLVSFVDTGLMWVSDVCNAKNPDDYNGVNLIYMGMGDSKASPKLENSPFLWGPLAIQLSCSGYHLWRKIPEVISLWLGALQASPAWVCTRAE